MSEVKLRPKGQIAIPAHVLRAAKLPTDAAMHIDYINGVITLTPIQLTSDGDDIMRYAGSLACGVLHLKKWKSTSLSNGRHARVRAAAKSHDW